MGPTLVGTMAWLILTRVWLGPALTELVSLPAAINSLASGFRRGEGGWLGA